jgi:hypothetical protein
VRPIEATLDRERDMRLYGGQAMTPSTTPYSIADTSAAQDTLTVAELAVMLRIHPVTVRLHAAQGLIPGRQIGNR